MPQISLTIPGSIVSKKNSRRPAWIGGKNVPRRMILLPSKAYSRWEKRARTALWYKHTPLSISIPIQIKAVFYYKGNKPDLAGAMESIADCLQGLLYVDDSQIMSWDGSRTIHDLKNPRTEVSIYWDSADQLAEVCKIADDAGL